MSVHSINVNDQPQATFPSIASSNSDFDIRDTSGYILTKFKDGHLKTKKFDSEIAVQTTNTYADLDFIDSSNNCVMRVNNGHIMTKNFNSATLDSRIDEKIRESTIIPASHWKNKKILFFGDSITQMGLYVNSYQNLTNCIAVNRGISGQTIAKRTLTDSNAFETRVSSLDSDVAAVVVLGGTNDFGHKTGYADDYTFGTFEDYQSNALTFYAGCHRMCLALYNRYKGKPVIIMTPVHYGSVIRSGGQIVTTEYAEYVFNADGTFTVGKNQKTEKTFIEYVNAIKEVASYYSFIVLDSYTYSGINPAIDDEVIRNGGDGYYTSDGLHLNARGGQKLAKWMYPQMEDIYEMFY